MPDATAYQLDSVDDTRRATVTEPNGAFPGLRPGDTYSFRVRAVLATGAGAASGDARSIDLQAYAPCSSPTTYRNLRVGLHLFAVRAIDAYGQRSPFAAKLWISRGGAG